MEQYGQLMWSSVQIAKVLQWRRERTVRWLKRHDACTNMAPPGRRPNWYASAPQLRRVFREATDEMIVRMSLSE